MPESESPTKTPQATAGEAPGAGAQGREGADLEGREFEISVGLAPKGELVSPPAGANGSGAPGAGVKRLPEHILDAIAMQTLQGTPYGDISRNTGVPKPTVEALVRDGSNQKFQRILEGYREKLLLTVGQNHFKMVAMLDKVHRAIERALDDDTDNKLAVSTAFDVMDRVIPRPEADRSVNVSLGLTNTVVNNEMSATLTSVSDSFVDLMQIVATQDPNKHVLDGTAALPSAYNKLPETTQSDPEPEGDPAA
jgi:hypothetical protein